MNDQDQKLLRKLIQAVRQDLRSMQEVLDRQHPVREHPQARPTRSNPSLDGKPDDIESAHDSDPRRATTALPTSDSGDGASRVIEGVFDGLRMVGPDGKIYSIPTNYASKTKLVEGDVMKLTIAPDGTFVYKHIAPIERERMVGVLTRDDETEEYRALANGKQYRVLFASVSYFKGEPGDECVILVPKGGQSAWAALENVIKEPAGSPEGISALMARSASQSVEPEQKEASTLRVAATAPLAAVDGGAEPARLENAPKEAQRESTIEELEDIEEL